MSRAVIPHVLLPVAALAALAAPASASAASPSCSTGAARAGGDRVAVEVACEPEAAFEGFTLRSSAPITGHEGFAGWRCQVRDLPASAAAGGTEPNNRRLLACSAFVHRPARPGARAVTRISGTIATSPSCLTRSALTLSIEVERYVPDGDPEAPTFSPEYLGPFPVANPCGLIGGALRAPNLGVGLPSVVPGSVRSLTVRALCAPSPLYGGPCRGRIRLEAVVAGRRTTLGRASFSVREGGRSALRVPLTAAARRLLGGGRRVRARLVVTQSAGARAQTMQRAVTLAP